MEPYARVHLAFPAGQYPAVRRALGWPHWWSWRVHGSWQHPLPGEEAVGMERMSLGVRLPRRDRTPTRQWRALRRLVSARLDAHGVVYRIVGVTGCDGTEYLPRS